MKCQLCHQLKFYKHGYSNNPGCNWHLLDKVTGKDWLQSTVPLTLASQHHAPFTGDHLICLLDHVLRPYHLLAVREMRPIVTDVARSVVCVSVSGLDTEWPVCAVQKRFNRSRCRLGDWVICEGTMYWMRVKIGRIYLQPWQVTSRRWGIFQVTLDICLLLARLHSVGGPSDALWRLSSSVTLHGGPIALRPVTALRLVSTQMHWNQGDLSPIFWDSRTNNNIEGLFAPPLQPLGSLVYPDC